ncbi:MAG: UDP-N-acetylmuramate--L-alanine ligase [bacterium]
MKVFIVGIKGVAMAALAVILTKMGYKVIGSDVKEKFITDEELEKNNIKVLIGFDPSDIENDLSYVVYSGANEGRNNPQVLKAKSLGLKTITQAELISTLLKDFEKSIAITGSHGKTTTSSLLSYTLIKLNQKPSYMVGTSSFNGYAGGDFNQKKYFVFEADEYAVNPPFDKTIKLALYNPDYSIITNIDFDHPDVYKDINQTIEVFEKFIKNTGKTFICIDDEHAKKIVTKLNSANIRTFGFSKEAEFRAMLHRTDINGSYFNVNHNGEDLGTFSTKLYGEKNISNTIGAICLLLDLGFKIKEIKDAIEDFVGAKRRFELIYKKNETFLFDDYAHHPNEIKATIDTTRDIFKNRRLIIIFQSHTYSRTQKFLKEFAESLSLADLVYILPIFSSAREDKSDFKVSVQSIVNAEKNKHNLKSVIDKKDLLNTLKTNLRKGDVVFTMGAGNQNMLAPDIIELINNLK